MDKTIVYLTVVLMIVFLLGALFGHTIAKPDCPRCPSRMSYMVCQDNLEVCGRSWGMCLDMLEEELNNGRPISECRKLRWGNFSE